MTTDQTAAEELGALQDTSIEAETKLTEALAGAVTASTAARIYVASSWRNDEQPVMVQMLRMAGHDVYDFRHPHLGPGERGLGFQWSQLDPEWEAWTAEQYREALAFQRASDGFAADLAGMEWADTCVLLLQSGRSAHAEAGWMAGKGKRVIVHIPGPTEPELMYLLFDRITVNKRELLDAVG